MTAGPDPVGDVLPLRRPPIRQATTVRSDLAHTFDVFVATIGSWWPTRSFSIGHERVVDVTFTRQLGGPVYETWDDGRTVDWGRVLVWEPPTRFAISWEILPAVTEVELAFRPLGPQATRVELAHRGWERLSDEQLDSVGGGYEAGWSRILAAFTAAAEAR